MLAWIIRAHYWRGYSTQAWRHQRLRGRETKMQMMWKDTSMPSLWQQPASGITRRHDAMRRKNDDDDDVTRQRSTDVYLCHHLKPLTHRPRLRHTQHLWRHCCCSRQTRYWSRRDRFRSRIATTRGECRRWEWECDLAWSLHERQERKNHIVTAATGCRHCKNNRKH